MSNLKIIKNSSYIFIKLIITSVLGIVSSRFLLNGLGANDYGLYNVVGGIVVILNLLNIALVSTSFRFIAIELGKSEDSNPTKIFNISFLIHVCLAILLIVLSETLGRYYITHYLNVSANRISDAFTIFRLSMVATAISIVSVPFQALNTAKENFSVNAIIEIISSILRFSIVILIINFDGDRLILYANLMVFAIIFAPLFYVFYCSFKYKDIIKIKLYLDSKLYKSFLSFSSWIFIGASSSIFKTQGVAILINLFFGTVLNASFGLANQLNTFILMFAQNIGQASVPQITKSYSAGNFLRVKNLVTSISKFTFFLMLIPSVPILLNTELILTLWLKELPVFLVIFCKLMIINALLDALISSTPAAIHASGKIKYYQLVLSSISLLVIPVAFILFKNDYPPYTIFILYIIASVIIIMLSHSFMSKILELHYKEYFIEVYIPVFKVILALVPLFFINLFITYNFFTLICFLFISSIWIVFSVYFFGLGNNEKQIVLKNIWKWKQKIFSNQD